MNTVRRPDVLRVSIEGINGVGKTTVVRAVAARLGARALLVDELTDQHSNRLATLVIEALNAGGDPFLRTGHPIAETLALLALQVEKFERLTEKIRPDVEVVLEDRGLDSVAVYQAVVLCQEHSDAVPEAVMRRVLSSIRPWRVFPDATVLLTGDVAVCTTRFADRLGRELTPCQRRIIEHIDALYRSAAADDPARYTLVEVDDLSVGQATKTVGNIVNTLLDCQVAHGS